MGLPYTLEMAVKSLIDRILDLYTKGELSFGAAVEQAGVPRSELSRYAYARGLEPPFSDATLAEETRLNIGTPRARRAFYL